MYNLAAIPIAAGVIYPAGHARLDPVWGSLAMALSYVECFPASDSKLTVDSVLSPLSVAPFYYDFTGHRSSLPSKGDTIINALASVV